MTNFLLEWFFKYWI